ERARAENRAQQTQKRFQDLFEFAPDAIIMADSKGVIAVMNKQAEALFGYGRSEIIGQPIEILMPVAFRHSHVAMHNQYYEKATYRSMNAERNDLRGLRKDGTEFAVDVSLSPLEFDGEMWVAAAVRDV